MSKAKYMMYTLSNARPFKSLYLGDIANNQYRIAQKAMPLSIVTNMFIALEIHQVSLREQIVSQTWTK